MIKVKLELSGGRISNISISGDFFMYPEEAIRFLERELEGTELRREALQAAVKKFYGSTGVITPMLEPEHWVEAIIRAAGGEGG